MANAKDFPPPQQKPATAIFPLAAGIFFSLFCYAATVVCVARAASRARPLGLSQIPTHRQVWRMYAAYLRLLLIIASAFLLIYGLARIARYFGVPARRAEYWQAGHRGQPVRARAHNPVHPQPPRRCQLAPDGRTILDPPLLLNVDGNSGVK